MRKEKVRRTERVAKERLGKDRGNDGRGKGREDQG